MKNILKTYNQLIKQNLSPRHREMIEREMILYNQCGERKKFKLFKIFNVKSIYDFNDFDLFLRITGKQNVNALLQTLEDLLARDKKREEDGFPRRIKIGKFIKPDKSKKEQIVVVPSTTEPKFYHDNSTTDESDQTGGSGKGDEGDVLGEKSIEPTEGEGDASGAGQGDGSDHDISSDAFDLGKILTERFELPNLKPKGKKVSLTKYQYDLTDKNRGFGQLLDKRDSLKKILETNIILGKIDPADINPEDLVVNPNDKIYRIMSKEKDYEAQAVVFFIRDYSGSMQGKPTEVVVTQHLLIYSWLMFQYQKNVIVRFVLHDTEAKEVKDFYQYYKLAVAGGTSVYSAYEYVADVIEKERLAKEYNIFVFHGTDGDDWEEKGEKSLAAIKRMLPSLSRMGITVARNSWTVGDKLTTVEQYVEDSGLLKEKNHLLRLDTFSAETATEERIVEGIKKLLG